MNLKRLTEEIIAETVLASIIESGKEYAKKHKIYAYHWHIFKTPIDDRYLILRFTHTIVPNGDIESAYMQYEYMCFDQQGKHLDCEMAFESRDWEGFIKSTFYAIYQQENN